MRASERRVWVGADVMGMSLSRNEEFGERESWDNFRGGNGCVKYNDSCKLKLLINRMDVFGSIGLAAPF